MLNLSTKIAAKFPGKKIAIIGDLVADQFLRGTIARVSREAPVFILRHDETETLAGAAANAAVNVASLGGSASLVGVVGEDMNGKALLEKLRSSNVNCSFIIASGSIQTTTKVRVLAGQRYAPRQQVIRIDYENSAAATREMQDKLKENLTAATETADAIVVSDYNYGVVNAEIFDLAKKIAAEKNIPLLVDSRFCLKDFPHVTTATPNQDEVEQILGTNFDETSCVELCRELGYKALLVTRGNDGMLLIENGQDPVRLDAVGSKQPIDVTGAGDTVIAAYALGLASGLSFTDAANVANHAGGIVVMKRGTASVALDELRSSIEKLGDKHANADAADSGS